jgi:hypothetical protein
MAPIPPVSAARSVSFRMRNLSFALKVRRRGRSDSSGDGALGIATTVGLRELAAAVPPDASVGLGSMGMIGIILPRHRV